MIAVPVAAGSSRRVAGVSSCGKSLGVSLTATRRGSLADWHVRVTASVPYGLSGAGRPTSTPGLPSLAARRWCPTVVTAPRWGRYAIVYGSIFRPGMRVVGLPSATYTIPVSVWRNASAVTTF